MTSIQDVRRVFSEFSECYDAGGVVVVPMQHLYPSNSNVSVYVESIRHDQYRVTDGGGALDELTALGLDVIAPDSSFRPTCRACGVNVQDGVIVSPTVPLDGIASAAIFVSMASAKVVERMSARLRPPRHRDLRALVGNELVLRFGEDSVGHNYKVSGASNKQYEFDFSVQLPGNQTLLLDMATPEPASINSKVVANMDVAKNEDGSLLQRILFDDEDEWSASDLSLLQMAAVTIPITGFRESLSRFVVH